MFLGCTGHLFTWKSAFGRESCSNAAKPGFATLDLCQLLDKVFLVGTLVPSFWRAVLQFTLVEAQVPASSD
jgi:hypothetical protein